MELLAVVVVVVLVPAILVGVFRVLAPNDRTKKKKAMPREPRTYVTFSGGKHYATEDEKEAQERNDPIAPGEGVLRAIGRELTARGFILTEFDGREWCAEVDVLSNEDKEPYGVRVGPYGDGDDDDDEWLLTIDAPKRRTSVEKDPKLTSLVECIDASLRTLDHLSNVRWHNADDWDAGISDAGWKHPTADAVA